MDFGNMLMNVANDDKKQKQQLSPQGQSQDEQMGQGISIRIVPRKQVSFATQQPKKRERPSGESPQTENQFTMQLSQRLKRMYKFPASYKEALVHKKAYKNGFKTAYSLKEGERQQFKTLACPCCQNFVNTIEIPICYDTLPKKRSVQSQHLDVFQNIIGIKAHRMKSNRVFQMQPGDALFFCFVKLLIAYLFLRFLIVDIYNLYTNVQGNYCSSNPQLHAQGTCNTPWIDLLSTPNKNTPINQHFFIAGDIINVAFTVISMFYFMYGRFILYSLYKKLQSWDVTQDDFTILIQDIPHIPFEASNERVKDVNRQYQTFIKKIIQKKINVWLNKFFVVDEDNWKQSQILVNYIDTQFYQKIYLPFKKQNNQNQLYDDVVSNVNLCYDLTQLEHLEQIRSKLVQNFILTQGKQQAEQRNLFDDQSNNGNQDVLDDQYISFIPQQIQIINRHYVKVCQRISQPMNGMMSLSQTQAIGVSSRRYDKNIDYIKISRFVGKAFVTLKYQHFKEYLLNKSQEDINFIRVNGNSQTLKLSQAGKPNDIYWNNMKISDQFRAKQVRNSYFLVAISIFVSGLFIFGLTYLKTLYSTTSNKVSVFENIYLYALPVVTFLINYALNWALGEFNAFQRHQSRTKQLSSLVIKNVASKFFNTAFIYALVYIFGPKVNFLNQNGIVYIITSLVLVNALLNIGTQIVQPYYLYLDYWANKQIHKNGQDQGTVNLFQIQLNDIIEDPHYSYDYSYSYYLQMIFIISFYGYLVPMTVPLLIIAFIAQYWVDKYNLLRRFSSPVDLGFFLTDLIWKCLQSILILKALGHLVWSYYLHLNLSNLTIFLNASAFVLSIAYMFMVIYYSNSVYTFLDNHFIKQPIYIHNYNKASSIFSKTYEAENPATAFIEKKDPFIQDLVGRVTSYSLRQGRKKNRFVPQNQQKLDKILQNDRDETTILMEVQEQGQNKNEKDFKIFCCC